MSEQLELGQNWELRDAAGHTVGIVLAQKAAQDLTAERDRLREESGQLRKQLAELQTELASWQEKARSSEERATRWEKGWHELFRLIPKEMQVTKEDIEEIQRNGIPFEDVIRELEQM